MRKLVFFALSLFGGYLAKSQKSNDQVTLMVESTVPVYQNDQGFGGFIKGAYGVGKSAQLTLTAGYSKFHSNNSIEVQKTITRLIPFLAGYKQNINKFYVEPQIGLGELGGTVNEHGDFARPSVAALFWAVGAGVNIKQFEMGLRFQSAHGIEGNSAGVWHNQNFHYTSVYFSYNLFRRK